MTMRIVLITKTEIKRNGITTQSILNGLIGTLNRIKDTHNWPYYAPAEKREAIDTLCWIGHTLEEATALVENELKANNF
ncbi:MAG: hypothetical protein NC131_09850 [Roseburia sp.]|nr:hypothetical protein [Roseburia sp.]